MIFGGAYSMRLSPLSRQRFYNEQNILSRLTQSRLVLLVNGGDSLASSWKLKSLIEEIKNDPGVLAAGERYGRNTPSIAKSEPSP